jgi:hypothetical protein
VQESGKKEPAVFWHPFRVRFVFADVPGVSLALNPRLISGNLSGCVRRRRTVCNARVAERWIFHFAISCGARDFLIVFFFKDWLSKANPFIRHPGCWLGK